MPRLCFLTVAQQNDFSAKKVVPGTQVRDLVWKAEGLAARGVNVGLAPEGIPVRNRVRPTLFLLAMRPEPSASNASIESVRRLNPRTIPTHAPLCFQAAAIGHFNPAIFDSNCGHLSKSLTKFH